MDILTSKIIKVVVINGFLLASGTAAAVPSQINTSEKVVVFNPASNTWAAYNQDGNLVRSGRASGGANWCKDVKRPCHTPVGTFRVYSKGNSQCRSSRFPLPRGGAPMPNCMHFHGAYALHGSNDVPNYNASHGCVRLPVGDAKWLSNNFVNVGTKVVVKPYGASSSKYASNQKRNRSASRSRIVKKEYRWRGQPTNYATSSDYNYSNVRQETNGPIY